MRKYHIKTFGCAMNHSDSERIAAFLEKYGFSPVSDIAKADLVIFNTCGVRQMAEDRVYGQTHNLKKSDPEIKIVLTGCLANRKDVQRRLKNKVDLFFPIDKFESLENFIIGNCLEIRNPKSEILARDKCTNQESIAYLSIQPKYSNDFQASVPIMTGCNNFCAYCVVPYARGREASRPAGEIIAEIKKLVESGYKEITLLGQNVNSYCDRGETPLKGFHPYKTINFPKLLKKIDAIPGKFWIRFTSNHPKDVTDEMIEAVAKCKKACENFHLPIQAGNDTVLRNMNRKYTAGDYMETVRKIKSAFKKYKPGIPLSLTSDIIVGFPGETKKQFLDSAKIMEKAKYDMVFFGQFSPRPGTAAWKMKDNVSKPEKKRRERILNEILKKTALANSKKFLDTTAEVLIEKEKPPRAKLLDSKSLALGNQHIYFGKTRTAKNVKVISAKKNLIGKFVKVKITKAGTWNLEGITV